MTLKRSLVSGVLLSTVALLPACEACTPEEINTLKPKISVDACLTEGIRDCAAAFGTLANGRHQKVKIRITNTGEADLNISNVRLSDVTDPAFTIVEPPPPVISPGEENSATMEVDFGPVVATAVAGQLIIESDAANLAEIEQPNVTIDLAGIGEDLGQPHLTINPPQCDFGEVAVGVAAFCDVSLGNDGQVELSITNVGYVMNNDPAFSVAGAFPIPLGLPPGSATTVRVQFRPSLAQAYTGGIFFDTTDPTQANVIIPLTGQGGAAPTAVARVLSINGNPTQETSPTVQPLDNVIVTGVDSAAGTPGRMIVGYLWEIIEKPEGSTVVLSTPTAQTAGFVFNSSGQMRAGLDVAGTFTVKLTVTDDGGATSTNDARVTLNAVPQEDLHVQVTWDDPTSDIDLHLIKGLGPRWSNNDCYYGNCKLANGLNWGGGTANPHLDVDDTNGFGPENINIEQPNDGNYTVGVHWFGGGQAQTVTVKIFVQGALLGEYSRQLTRCDQWWDVAKIIWGSAATVQDINTVAVDPDSRDGCL